MVMGNRGYEIWDARGNEEESWVKYRRFAISYKKAFLTLIEKERLDSSADRCYDDEDILPALHLFHHYLELSLKSLLEKIEKNFKSHKLNELLTEVEKAYPDLKLSKSSKKLIVDSDFINKERPVLDLEGFRYPKDTKDNSIWVSKENFGSLINLNGVYISSKRLILEIEEYFNKKKTFKLPIKPFYASSKLDKSPKD